MENWFKDTGRPALFEALAKACDHLDSNLNAGLQRLVQDRTELASEVGSLRRTAAKASHLEKENQSLRLEIEELRKTSRSEPHSKESPGPRDADRNIRTPLAPRSANSIASSRRPDKPLQLDIGRLKPSELKEEYLRLEGNYTKLHERYLELEHVHAESTRLLRERTAVYNQWVDHAKQLDEKAQSRSRKIKRLETRLAEVTKTPLASSFGSNSGSVRPAEKQESEVFGQNNSKNSDKITTARPNQVSGTSPLSRLPLDIDGRARESSTGICHVRTTGTYKNQELEARGPILQTESQERDEDGEAPSLPPLLQNCESTGPQILIKSEPSSDTPVVVSERSLRKRKHSDNKLGHIAASPRVKAEHSSDPLVLDERHHFTAQESIDFDAVAGNIQTPRKRGRFFRVRTSRHEDTPGRGRVLPDVGNPPNELAPTNERSDSHDGFSHSSEGCIDALSRKHTGRALLASQSDSDRHSILRPCKTLQDDQAKTNATSTSKRRKHVYISRGIASLAEDDDQEDKTAYSTKKRSRSAILHQLLDGPSPELGFPRTPSGARLEDVSTTDLFRFT